MQKFSIEDLLINALILTLCALPAYPLFIAVSLFLKFH